MALVGMKALLDDARAGNYAVGAFNIANMESLLGVLQAAEALRSPVILQVAEVRLHTSPLWLLGPMLLAAARHATVRVAVHFDHGISMERIEEALALGFTSVMYDGSQLPLEENIANTQRVMAMARACGASVEAEVGSLGRAEDGAVQKAVCADVPECLRMVRETGVDALAVAIGNMHGVYAQSPQLRFDVLEALCAQDSTPWVLHGGTGLTEGDFRRAISLGVRKINIGTDIYMAATEGEGENPFAKMESATAAVAAVTERHIRIFGSEGRER